MKKVCFDTSVLISAMVRVHPSYKNCFPWLKRAKAKEFEVIISQHTLAELFAVLTALPLSPKISPGMAQRLIHDNVENTVKIITLSISDYKSAIQRMIDLNLTGAIFYDVLIAITAIKAKADQVLTLNPKDFRRILPENQEKVISPLKMG